MHPLRNQVKPMASLFLIVPITLIASELTISTRDSLSLVKGLYASILFTASGDNPDGVPSLYRFSESGDIPPGMIFERYPCNKPDHPPCPSVAKPDGIFLDGVPSTAGSYTIAITATDSKENTISRRFVVTVKERKKARERPTKVAPEH